MLSVLAYAINIWTSQMGRVRYTQFHTDSQILKNVTSCNSNLNTAPTFTKYVLAKYMNVFKGFSILFRRNYPQVQWTDVIIYSSIP